MRRRGRHCALEQPEKRGLKPSESTRAVCASTGLPRGDAPGGHCRHGLLSGPAPLSRFQITSRQHRRIKSERRPQPVALCHAGVAVIRDDSRLRSAPLAEGRKRPRR